MNAGFRYSADNIHYPSSRSGYMNLKIWPAGPVMATLDLPGGLGISDMLGVMPNGLDDRPIAFQDSICEEPLFQAPQDIQLPHRTETSKLISIAMPVTSNPASSLSPQLPKPSENANRPPIQALPPWVRRLTENLHVSRQRTT
jgi:hypothetical protein